jgi:outer membrane protein assembly factor BamB
MRSVRILVFAMLLAMTAEAENWPQWRGPSADGISTETDVPTRWSATENVLWKAPLHGLGTSTPIVWRERIFVTSQLGDGPVVGSSRDFEGAEAAKKTGTSSSVSFFVHAFARQDGKLLWERSFVADEELPEVHRKHNLASPSCVTEGERVYAWFGTGLAVAITLEGEVLWTRHLGKEKSRFDVRWGHGSSPVLYDNALLLLVDHPHDSYLLAVDKHSGKDLWRLDREEKRSYTTPFVIRREEGDQLIINTNDRIEALDPQSGKLLWHVGQPNRVPVATPVYHDGLVYSNRGYFSGPFLAVGIEGTGNVNESQLKWRVPTGAPYVSSLLYYRGLIFMATDRGIASAIDADTGETIWKHRLGTVFTASPVAADGKVYLLEENGKTHVIEAARELKPIAENDIGERTLASLAISDGLVFLRSDHHLFAIGGR